MPIKILAATDGGPQARLAVQKAVNLCSRTGSELHLVHVGEVPAVYHPEMRGYPSRLEMVRQQAGRLLEEEVARLRSAGVEIAKPHLRIGRTDVEIVELAEEMDADVIVVGSRGLGGMRRALVGSVSDSVVRHAHCPVLVVR